MQKQEIITFKVDSDLADIIKRLPNRSDFIRKAILNSLENTCPLCQGAGIINPSQKRHWEAFLKTHEITHCDECDSIQINCIHGDLPIDSSQEVNIHQH